MNKVEKTCLFRRVNLIVTRPVYEKVKQKMK